MFKVEYKANVSRARWKCLSIAKTDRNATWHSFGWMILFGNSSWRETRCNVTRCEELIEALRGRQAKLDAPRVLDACEMAGVCVFLAGEELKVRGPLTDEIRFDLKRCKPELLKLLADVPPWDDAEYIALERGIQTANKEVMIALYPPEDDVFTVAARNVLADALASFVRAKATRRIDHCRRRAEWLTKWFGTMERTIKMCRSPGLFNDDSDPWKPDIYAEGIANAP